MRTYSRCVCALIIGVAAYAAAPKTESTQASVDKALAWLVSVQGSDGGWGQDGGAASHVRQQVALETRGNDPANTAVAVLALLHAGGSPNGKHGPAIRKGAEFVLKFVEQSPDKGLSITSIEGTQIQRKLGPHIDTFLSSMMLSELDGQMGDKRANARVRAALEKCVAKVQQNQQSDGSWNVSGGWAPILGTSMASRSLYRADQKGVKVDKKVLAQVATYSQNNARDIAAGRPAGGDGGVIGGIVGGVPGGVPGGRPASVASAGVPLYERAQALEQLTRTEKDRKANAKEIRELTKLSTDEKVVVGFGSMGGEEFFSYLNMSDSLRRVGGDEWSKWNSSIKTKLLALQNGDGTWAGHHCITGRVAVTSAAVMTLVADRQPVIVSERKSDAKAEPARTAVSRR